MRWKPHQVALVPLRAVARNPETPGACEPRCREQSVHKGGQGEKVESKSLLSGRFSVVNKLFSLVVFVDGGERLVTWWEGHRSGATGDHSRACSYMAHDLVSLLRNACRPGDPLASTSPSRAAETVSWLSRGWDFLITKVLLLRVA